MKHIASCSFGKDSIAAIIARIEHGEPIDEIVYCRIMYDENTSAEYPKHEEFIHNRAIPELERRYGLKTTVVQAERTYLDIFYSKYKSGKNIGKTYGFPFTAGPWCNNRLKTTVISQYENAQGEHKTIVGIAADEPKRIQRALDKGQILPLVDYGITESMAFDICYNEPYLWEV